MAQDVTKYTTEYGGTGTNIYQSNPDGTFWSSSTPDDPVAAAANLARYASGKVGTGVGGGGGPAGSSGGFGSTSDVSNSSLLNGLSGPNRDAAVALTNLFQSYGLGSLAPKIVQFIQQGYSSDTVTVLLQQTPEYQKRFSGNAARLKAGLPVLSPAEYLSTESAYRQVMQQAGLPVGFYDSPQDFSDFISRDVSPTEVQQRVNAASELLNSASPEALSFFQQHYSKGDLVAYALDPTKAAPLIEKQVRAAELAGAGMAAGVNVDTGLAERLDSAGVGQQQASQGFGFIAGETANADKLSRIYGDAVSQQDLVQETFFNDATASKKRRTLASKERATFSGSAGLSSQSLDRNDAGSF